MKTSIAACAILLASAGAGWSQSALPCDPSDPADMTDSCSTAPSEGSGSSIQGTFDQGTTSAIPQPQTPQGMTPLVVPNDPLDNLNQNPIGTFQMPGTSGNGTTGGITSPSIKPPAIEGLR